MLLDKFIRVLRPGDAQHPDRESRASENVDRALCRILSGIVRIVADNDVFGIARQQPRLFLGQRRAERRHCTVKARLMQGDDIHIALSEQKIVAFCLFCDVHRKQIAALVEDHRLGRVEIFRLAVVHHASAKGDDITADVDDREHHTVSELVIVCTLRTAHNQSGRKQFLLGVSLCRHRVEQRVEGIRRIAQSKIVHRPFGQRAPHEVFHRRLAARRMKLCVKPPRRLLHQLEQTVAPLPLTAVGGVLRHLHAVLFGEEPHRIRKLQTLDLHHKADGTSTGAAAEAVENLLIRCDRKGCGFFVVKRTQSEIIASAFFERNVAGYQIDNITARIQLIQKALIDRHTASLPCIFRVI